MVLIITEISFTFMVIHDGNIVIHGDNLLKDGGALVIHCDTMMVTC